MTTGEFIMNVIYYDVADIDSTICAAILQSNGIGKAVSYLSDNTVYRDIYTMLKVPKTINCNEIITINRDDLFEVDLNTDDISHLSFLNKCSYLSHHLVGDLPEQDFEIYVRMYARLMQADPDQPVEHIAALYALVEEAKTSIEEGLPFMFHIPNGKASVEAYMAFMNKIKTILTEKIQLVNIDVSKKILGFLPRSPKYVDMGLINIDLSYTPWIARLASHSLSGVLVYEFDRYGGQIHAAKIFTNEGEYAYEKIVKLGVTACST